MSTLQPANWKTIPGPADIVTTRLPNGITVLARSNFNSQSVVLSGYLPSGSIYDPVDRLGLAYFTAISLMRGNAHRNFQAIYNELESIGASLSIGASVHTTSFGGRSLAEDLPTLLALLSDSLRSPTFPSEYVERLRKQILTSLAIREQDTSDIASMTFDQILFGGHPYAYPEDGFTETIQNIRLEDLVAFHHDHYGPSGMVVAIVGGIDPQAAIAEVSAHFSDWDPNHHPPLPDLPQIQAPTEIVRRHMTIAGKSQTDIVMGGLGPKRTSPDYLAASLGNNILGQFGMMGRIGDVVREKSGLAYHASASLNAWLAAGSWEVSAGVNPSNVERSIDLIRKEIRRFISEPVSAEELEDSQSHFIGRLPLSLESNAGVAQAMLKMHRFNLGLDYYQRYPAMVAGLTTEDVLDVAQRYLDPDRMVIVSAGANHQQTKSE
ncbi:MAG TPA: pitrilysin family protein [Anaerolineaceae bacterium]|nr:pitrilysin family protein [Anaerolineaceae bacterium]